VDCSAAANWGNVADKRETTVVRGTAARILCVLALGLTLAGCDKCGNFFGLQVPVGLDTCKPNTPAPQ
jgi:hypothetical protein